VEPALRQRKEREGDKRKEKKEKSGLVISFEEKKKKKRGKPGEAVTNLKKRRGKGGEETEELVCPPKNHFQAEKGKGERGVPGKGLWKRKGGERGNEIFLMTKREKKPARQITSKEGGKGAIKGKQHLPREGKGG